MKPREVTNSVINSDEMVWCGPSHCADGLDDPSIR